MPKQITKAIIGVAGSGTRRLPITSAIEKCMLPLLNRPVVDYVVEDCVKAGITDICFVVNPDANQIQTYFDSQVDSYPGVNFYFAEQENDGRYGSSMALITARDFIAGESSFVLMGGDDTAFNADGSSELQRMIDMTTHTHQSSAMMAAQIDPAQSVNYGCLETTELNSYVRIVEKPEPQDAPSNLINISKFVLSNDILHFLDEQANNPLPEGVSEYQITDVLNAYAAEGGDIYVHTIMGKYLDAGSVEAWVAANQTILDAQKN